MERRILVFKTTERKNFPINFLKNIDEKYAKVIQNCYLAGLGNSELSPADIYSTCLPDLWTKVEKSQDIKEKITKNSAYREKDLTVLTDEFHDLLDGISSPGRYLLNILWICDSLPVQPNPGLYGALQRAVSWHNGQISVLTLKESEDLPSWVTSGLQAQIITGPRDDINLELYISPSLVWRGNLTVFNDEDLSSCKIQGYELHDGLDELDLIIQKINLSNPELNPTQQQDKVLVFYDVNLELVTEVDASSVPPSLLTNQRFKLKTIDTGEDDVSGYLMKEGFPNSLGFIARLRVSEKLNRKYKQRNSASWKREVVEGTYENVNEMYLADALDSMSFLVYDDGTQTNKCSQQIFVKSAILLRNPEDVCTVPRPFLSRDFVFNTDVVTAVPNLDIIETNIQLVHQYYRDLTAGVLNILLEEREAGSTQDLLQVVAENIPQLYSWIEKNSKLETNSVVLDEELKKPEKIQTMYRDDSSEKRVARIDARKQEIISFEKESALLSRRVDTISLEAKEIVKFFQKTGEPATALNLDNLTQGAKNTVRLSDHQYQKIFQDNFDHIRSGEFQYSGFKFKGDDFNLMEFTQFHDVYYNNGPKADQKEKDFRRYRDMYVGISKETSTTLDMDKAPEKLKLKKTKIGESSTQRSPRKKVGKTWTSPRKSAKILTTRSRKPSPVKGAGQKILEAQRRSRPNQKSSVDEMRKKNLRVAVYSALMEQGIKEDNQIFRRCFATLIKICQLLGGAESGDTTSKMMLDVARSNVENVIKAEVQKLRSA